MLEQEALPLAPARPRAADPKALDVHIQQALAVASQRVCPVWDIRSFIATNLLQGFEDEPFREAVKAAWTYFQAEALPSLEYFHQQYQAGRIRREDLQAAVSESRSGVGRDTEHLLALVGKEFACQQMRTRPRVRSLAEHVDEVEGTAYEDLIVRELSKWCAAYFDQGQASWPMPGRDRRLYTAWREAACFDRACALGGMSAFCAVVRQLPCTPSAAIARLVELLGVPPDDLADYLTRLLTRLPGWSGHVRYRCQNAGQGAGEHPGDLTDLVAMGLAYEWALVCSLKQGSLAGIAWEAIRGLGDARGETQARDDGDWDEDLEIRLIWQAALERGYRENLLRQLAAQVSAGSREPLVSRSAAQFVFCIDVRSEPLRRNLERLGPPGYYETFGFAGFFAFPIAHQPFGAEQASAQCPALLSPRFLIQEYPVGDGDCQQRASARRQMVGSLGAALSSTKTTAVSSYFHVESLGLLLGVRALMRSLLPGTLTRLGRRLMRWLGGQPHTRPRIDPCQESGCHDSGRTLPQGIPLKEQVRTARAALSMMGLTRNFSRLVVLCGHGSASENNPYAAALDCGACGGHEGRPNARVAAMVFNSPTVRQQLADGGIHIPADTWFVAAQHNTTTDEVEILDEDLIPASHGIDLVLLRASLREAGAATRKERERRFHPGGAPDSRRRASDWSEVRPEWGLAGNAAFIVGPRSLTTELDLQGRAFLHSYDWTLDADGSSLEVILTAPLIVAQWINLQYYLSSVDNRRFGSGDKTIHNVVGKVGVMQGNQSDLQVGLPWQSVSDGQRLVHEPLRLTAVVQAPLGRVEEILARHHSVRRLVEGEWIALVVLDPGEGRFRRYRSGGTWELITVT